MEGLPAFLFVAGVIIVTPGPDMALITRNAIAHGRVAALRTALGTAVGLLVWAAASAAGLATILQASALAYDLVRIAGAIYLVYLGAKMLIALLRSRRPAGDGSGVPTLMPASPFRQGLLCNLLNPKIAVLFTSLIPQFVTPGPSATLEAAFFALIFVALGCIWLTSLALFASTAGRVLGAPPIRRTLDALTGLVLVALGLRLATERS